MARPPNWLAWVHEMQTIAQAGLTYTRDPFDRERFAALQRLAAKILAERSGGVADEWLAELRAEPGYVTPKVDVRAVVSTGTDDPRILLVRETQDARWSLPGGWADVGESAAEVAAREVREEAGYAVRPTKLLAVLDKAKHAHPPQLWYVYKIFLRCELLGGEATTSLETTSSGWFTENELPPLSLDRNTPAQLRRMFEHVRRPELPADFD